MMFDVKAYKHWLYMENRERLLKADKEYKNKNRGEYLFYQKRYREANKDRLAEQKKAWYEKNKTEILSLQREQYKKNPDVKITASKKWRTENPEKAAQTDKRKRLKNLGKYLGYSQSYKQKKRNSVPLWADLKAINFFYECCPAGCHVDHIIPLQGKNISGLHVETNLQWLPVQENMRKGNSFNA